MKLCFFHRWRTGFFQVKSSLYPILLIALILLSCENKSRKINEASEGVATAKHAFLVVLGTVQDAGLPQLGCRKSCCSKYEGVKAPDMNVVSLGLIDPVSQKSFLFEATPDINRQLEIMRKNMPDPDFAFPDGVFLTHAHIGHYTGLIQLGREAYNASGVSVYAMPKMAGFLRENGPWDQLVSLRNIELKPIQHGLDVKITDKLSVTPLLVPHRDEYSETAGFVINGPNKKALFIPDIDKWDKWEVDVTGLIREVDYAFLDATFFDEHELNNRDISEIPHPFVVESMNLFSGLSAEEKAKVYFIHFNHTNPLLDPGSSAYQKVLDSGYGIAETHHTFPM